MATTVGQHSVATFTSPVNGTTPIDANTVRGNDNTLRTSYVDHDADPGIHVQSSTLASRPVAGTAGRKWITEDSGVYTLWFDDGTNWHPVSSENVALTVWATETLAKGDVIKVTGWNNGQDLPEVAKVSSSSDVAFAIITAAVSQNVMGYATNTGIVQDVATNSFSVGDILYPNTSGGFTSTKPTSGNYQSVAYVLRAHASQGVIFVEFSAPRIVESSSNTASTVVRRDASGNFSAGTVSVGALTSTGLVTFASLKGTGATTVTNILNDDTMATASATTLATSSSIKTYVDSKVATVDTLAEVLANGNTSGANNLIISSGQKIQTPTIAALDGTSAVTIANSTGALTLATALADTNLATISTAGKVSNSATTATSANTASAIVARDASGNFSAGTITATLSGAAPAGSLSGTTLASNVVSSSLTSVGTLANLTVTNTISGSVSGSSGSTTGNAATATALQTARNINGVSFNGTADITVTAAAGTLTGTTLASGVTDSSLTSVGTLSSLTVSGNTIVGAEVFRSSDTSYIRIAGGNPASIGGNLLLFGSTHATNPGRAVLTAVGTGYLQLATAGGSATLDSSGNVGIGCTPLTKFQVRAQTNGNLAVNTSLVSGGARLQAFNDAGSASSPLEIDGSVINFNISAVQKATLDTSGNLGLGVTPSAWSGMTALQLVNGAALASLSGGYTELGSNWCYNGGSKYIANGTATLYEQGAGAHKWFTAASGTAGNAISFTQAMTLDASGNLSNVGYMAAGDGQDFRFGTGTTTRIIGLAGGSGYMAFRTNDAERARIDASGNLGVGTASPGARLHISSNNEAVRLQAASTGNGIWYAWYNAAGTRRGYTGYTSNNDPQFNIANEEAGQIGFSTNGSERARITSGGKFYVNATSAPGADPQIYVESNAAPSIWGKNAGAGGYTFNSDAISNGGTYYHFNFLDAGTSHGSISSNGTNTAYNTTSDARLKTNVQDAADASALIDAIQIRQYDWKSNGSHQRYGVVAQEVDTVFPEMVTKGETDDDMWSVDYSKLVPMLVKEIQSLRVRVAQLES